MGKWLTSADRAGWEDVAPPHPVEGGQGVDTPPPPVTPLSMQINPKSPEELFEEQEDKGWFTSDKREGDLAYAPQGETDYGYRNVIQHGIGESLPARAAQLALSPVMKAYFPKEWEEYREFQSTIKPRGGGQEFAHGLAAILPELPAFSLGGATTRAALAQVAGRQFIKREVAKGGVRAGVILERLGEEGAVAAGAALAAEAGTEVLAQVTRRTLARKYGTQIFAEAIKGGGAKAAGLKAATSAGMFGQVDVVREGLMQATEGYFSPAEMAKAGLHGVVVGAVIGGSGAPFARAAGRIPAEAAAMTVAGAALEGDAPKIEDFGVNVLFFSALSAVHAAPSLQGQMRQMAYNWRSRLGWARGGKLLESIKYADPKAVQAMTYAMDQARQGNPHYYSMMAFIGPEKFRSLAKAEIAYEEAKAGGDSATVERARAEFESAKRQMNDTVDGFRKEWARTLEKAEERRQDPVVDAEREEREHRKFLEDSERQMQRYQQELDELRIFGESDTDRGRAALAAWEEYLETNIGMYKRDLARAEPTREIPILEGGEARPEGVVERAEPELPEGVVGEGRKQPGPAEPPILEAGEDPRLVKGKPEELPPGEIVSPTGEQARLSALAEQMFSIEQDLEGARRLEDIGERERAVRDLEAARIETARQIDAALETSKRKRAEAAEAERKAKQEKRTPKAAEAPAKYSRQWWNRRNAALRELGYDKKQIEEMDEGAADRIIRESAKPGTLPLQTVTREQMPSFIPKESRGEVIATLRAAGYTPKQIRDLKEAAREDWGDMAWAYYEVTGKLPSGTSLRGEAEGRPSTPREEPPTEKPPPSDVSPPAEGTEKAEAPPKPLTEAEIKAEADAAIAELEGEEPPKPEAPKPEPTAPAPEPEAPPSDKPTKAFIVPTRGEKGGVEIKVEPVEVEKPVELLRVLVNEIKTEPQPEKPKEFTNEEIEKAAAEDEAKLSREDREASMDRDYEEFDAQVADEMAAAEIANLEPSKPPSKPRKATTKVSTPQQLRDKILEEPGVEDALKTLKDVWKGKKLYDFPGPLVDPDVHKAVIRLGVATIRVLSKEFGKVVKGWWKQRMKDVFSSQGMTITDSDLDSIWNLDSVKAFVTREEKANASAITRGGGKKAGQPGTGKGRRPDVPATEGAEEPGVPAGGAARPEMAGAGGEAGRPGGGEVEGGRRGGKVQGAREGQALQGRTSRMDTRLEGDKPVELTPKPRREINEEVERILSTKTLDDLTDTDLELIRQYTGWGGLGKSSKDVDVAAQLEEGHRGVLWQHFTSYQVADSIWGKLEALGIKRERRAIQVLEPAVGSGNFLGLKPKGLRANFVGLDVEDTPAKVAKALYPQSDIRIMPFQQLEGMEGKFDLVIGNPPFASSWKGQKLPGGKPYADVQALHDMFVVKGIDQLKPGGVLAYVISTGFMDKMTSDVRQRIAGKARLVSAYRLPSGTFSKNAGFAGPVDVVFFQRLGADRVGKVPKVEVDRWVKSSPPGKDQPYLSAYYQNNPKHILGDLEIGLGQGKGAQKRWGVRGKFKGLPEDAIKLESIRARPEKEAKVEPPPDLTDAVPAGDRVTDEFFTENKKLYRVQSVEGRNWGVPYKSSDKGKVMVAAGAIELVRKIQQAELAGESSKVAKTALGRLLDMWMAKEGKPFAEFAAMLKKFPDHQRFTLEQLIREDGTYAAIVTKPTIFNKAVRPPAIDTRSFDQVSMDIGKRQGFVTAQEFLKEYTGKDLKTLDDVTTKFASLSEWNRTNEGWVHDSDYKVGDVRSKMREAEAMGLTHQVEKLRKVLPEQLDQESFTKSEDVATLAAGYLSESGVEDFWNYIGSDLLLAKVGVKWQLEGRGHQTKRMFRKVPKYERLSAATEILGVKIPADTDGRPIVNAEALLVARLNGTIYKATKDRTDPRTGAVTPGRSEAEAKAMNEALRAADEIFRNYLERQPKAAAKFLADYNELFRSFVDKKFPEDLDVEGLSTEYFKHIHPWQGTAVNFALHTGRGIIGLGTGTGKTFIGILLGQKLRQTGQAKKPLYVVPKSVLVKWEREYMLAFPGAKILRLGTLGKDRVKLLTKFALNDYDAGIISVEALKKVNLSTPRLQAWYQRKLQESLDALAKAKGSGITERWVQEQIAKWEEKLERLTDYQEDADAGILFEQLGVDALIVDEAHKYKNLAPVGGGLQNELGMGGDSDRSIDLEIKNDFILKQNGNRNVFFLTATPTPNAPIEIYSMLYIMAPDVWRRHGINSLHEFLLTFGEVAPKMVVDEQGYEKTKSDLVGFKNLIDLRAIFHRYVYFRTSDKLKQDFPNYTYRQPKGKQVRVELDPPPETESQMSEVTRDAQNPPTDPKARRGHILRVGNKAISVAVGPGLMDEKLADNRHPHDKLTRVANNVAEHYIKLKAERRRPSVEDDPNAPDLNGQLVFLNRYGGKAAEIYTMKRNYHERARDRMVELGIPREEIAIINGEQNNKPEQKQRIADLYNEGKLRVVIGSTASMGEGMDLQRITTAIHHWDMDWNPELMRQREGRGIRQGNLGDEVLTYYYTMRQTHDGKFFSKLESKSNWQIELLFGTADKMENPLALSKGMDSLASIAEDLMAKPADRYVREARGEARVAGIALGQLEDALTLTGNNLDKVREEQQVRKDRVEEYKRRAALSKQEGAFSTLIDKELDKLGALADAEKVLAAEVNKLNDQMPEAQQRLADEKISEDAALRVRDLVQFDNQPLGRAIQEVAFEGYKEKLPKKFDLELFAQELSRLGMDTTMAAMVESGSVTIPSIWLMNKLDRPKLEQAYKNLGYGSMPEFRPKVKTAMGAASPSEFYQAERDRQYLQAQAEYILDRAKEMGINLDGGVQKKLEKVRRESQATTRVNMKDSAIPTGKKGRELDSAEIQILSREGLVDHEKMAHLGKEAVPEEAIDAMTPAQKLVHMMRRVDAAMDVRHIENILKAKKYKTWALSDEDAQALMTKVGFRMRNDDIASYPKKLRGFIKQMEQGEEPGLVSKKKLASGRMKRTAFGLFPPRTALRGTGIYERYHVAYEGMKREWNLRSSVGEKEIFVDPSGRRVKADSIDDKLIYLLLDNPEGDERHLARPDVRMPDGRRMAPKEWHRDRAKMLKEVLDDLADRQGLEKGRQRKYYATHIMDRLLEQEAATGPI